MDSKSSPYSFTIREDVLRAAKVDAERIWEAASFVLSLFNRLPHEALVPREISNSSQLQSVLDLHSTFEPLVGQAGFQEFRQQFDLEHFDAHRFTAEVASALLPHTQKLIFEPASPSSPKRPDILLVWEDVGVFIECKRLKLNLHDYLSEHERVWNGLRGRVPLKEQITVTYRTPLSDEELNSLAQAICHRIAHATNTGTIIRNDRIRVHIQKQKVAIAQNPFSGIEFQIAMLSIHDDDKTVYPAHIFARNGEGLVVEGPEVSAKAWINDALSRAASQAPDALPFVLALDAGDLMGSYKKLHQAVYSEFQPEMNTRFSGVLFFKPLHGQGDKAFEFIRNPFARNPVPEGFEFWINRLPIPQRIGPFSR